MLFVENDHLTHFKGLHNNNKFDTLKLLPLNIFFFKHSTLRKKGGGDYGAEI
jgi:hypothetical protein